MKNRNSKTHFRCGHSFVVEGKLICAMGSSRENPNRERVPHQSSECLNFCKDNLRSRFIKRNNLKRKTK